MQTGCGLRPEAIITALLGGLLAATAMSAVPESGERAPSSDSGLNIAQAVALAVQRNSALAALQARADAQGHKPSQAGALPDPSLSLGLLNLPVDSFALDQEPMTQLRIGINQTLPFPGKRQLRRDAAQFEARAAAGDVAEYRERLKADVRETWWLLLYLDRALTIVANNKSLMRDLVATAETRYVVGEGLQQDLLLAQLELSRLTGRELRLQGQHRRKLAKFNRLLERQPAQPLRPVPAKRDVRLPELPSRAELLSQAGTVRSMLAARRQRLKAAELRARLAQKELHPDFSVGAAYGIRQSPDPFRRLERPDFFSLMFSVKLPLHASVKQRRAVAQHDSELSEQQYMLQAALRTVEAEVAGNLADYAAARDEVLLLKTAIIPQAQQTVASMLAGYQVDEVDFFNVINGQLTLYNAEIEYWQGLSRAKASLARLAAATGLENLYE